MVEILKEASLGSLNSIYTLAIIVIPIMIVLQILKDYNVLNKITKPFGFITRFFNISDKSILPLLVGFVFGLSYGAGVILQTARQEDLSERDLFLITIFLACCHAVFEDTLIFVAVGANGLILLGFRLFAALVLTYILSRRLTLEKTNN
mgnify:CR=1 FL=1